MEDIIYIFHYVVKIIIETAISAVVIISIWQLLWKCGIRSKGIIVLEWWDGTLREDGHICGNKGEQLVCRAETQHGDIGDIRVVSLKVKDYCNNLLNDRNKCFVRDDVSGELYPHRLTSRRVTFNSSDKKCVKNTVDDLSQNYDLNGKCLPKFLPKICYLCRKIYSIEVELESPINKHLCFGLCPLLNYHIILGDPKLLSFPNIYGFRPGGNNPFEFAIKDLD